MFKWDVIVWPHTHTHTHTHARTRATRHCIYTHDATERRTVCVCVCVCVHNNNNNNEIFEAAESLCNGRACIHTIFVHTQIVLYPRSWGCLQPDLITGGSIILWYTQPETYVTGCYIIVVIALQLYILLFTLVLSLSLSLSSHTLEYIYIGNAI